MLRIFLPSVATALEPPEQWIEYMHLKTLYTTPLQLSHNTAFPTKGWEWSEHNDTYQDISLLDKWSRVC